MNITVDIPYGLEATIDVSDLVGSIEVELDSDLLEAIVENAQPEEVLELLDDSDILSYVGSLLPEDVAGCLEDEFIQKLYRSLPELVLLAEVAQPKTALHDLALEVVSKVRAAPRYENTPLIEDLTRALDVLVRSPATRDLIHAALFRHLHMEKGDTNEQA